MAAPSFPGWRRAFYLPTTSDSGIVVLRKWLEEVAGERSTGHISRHSRHQQGNHASRLT